MKRLVSIGVYALLLLCILAPNLRAQATATATLLGTVLDKSGAVVPGADVKLTSKETGLLRQTTSSSTGAYRFDQMPVGKYDLRVAAKGFATEIIGNLELSVAQTATINATLSLSQQSEVI